MKTFCPFFRPAISINACQAVKPTSDGGRFRHREVLRLRGQVVFVDGDEFREGADAVLVRSRIDLVAGLELPYPGADPDHDTGHVVAQDQRYPIGQDQLELPIPDLGIQHVDARGVNLDQHVVLAHRRLRHVCGPQVVAGFSVAIDGERPHVSPPSG